MKSQFEEKDKPIDFLSRKLEEDADFLNHDDPCETMNETLRTVMNMIWAGEVPGVSYDCRRKPQ